MSKFRICILFFILFLSGANTDTVIPIRFIESPKSIRTINLKDKSVTNEKISDGSISTEKIQDGAIAPLKLGVGPGDNPVDGDIFVWENDKFVLTSSIISTSAAQGDGTVTTVFLGRGIVNDLSPITSTGIIEIDTGEIGDPLKTKIPFFSSTNQIVLDFPSKLYFKEAIIGFSFSNDGALKIKNELVPVDLLKVEESGSLTVTGDLVVEGSNLTVDGKKPCYEDGTNCQIDPLVKSISTDETLIESGTTDVNLSVNVGTGPNQIVQLDSSSKLPAVDAGQLFNLPGSRIYEVIAGRSLSGGGSTGDITLDVDFGSEGNTQEWKPHLEKLGNLVAIKHGVIIGTNTDFHVEAGDELKESIGLLPGRDIMAYDSDLAEIGNLNATNIGDYIWFNGSNWALSTVPNCNMGEAITGVSNDFSCTLLGILGPTVTIPNRLALFSDTTGNTFIETGYEFPTSIGTTNHLLRMGAGTSLEFALNSFLSAADGNPSQALAMDNNGNAAVSGLLAANGGNVQLGHNGSRGYLNNVGVGNLEFRKSGNNFMSGTTTSNSVNNGSNLSQGGGLNVGSWHVGAVAHSTTGWPGMSHVSCRSNSQNYSIIQSSSCLTLINSASGQPFQFQIGNVEAYRVDTSFQCPSGWTRYGKVCVSVLQGATAGSTASWACRTNNAHMCSTAEFREICNYNNNIITNGIFIGDTYLDDGWKVTNRSDCGGGNFDGLPEQNTTRQYRCCK